MATLLYPALRNSMASLAHLSTTQDIFTDVRRAPLVSVINQCKRELVGQSRRLLSGSTMTIEPSDSVKRYSVGLTTR